MIYDNMDAFHIAFFHKLHFIEHKNYFYSEFYHPDQPDLGKIYCFSVENFYKIFICNYTVKETFRLEFNILEEYLQLTHIMHGQTQYQLEQKPTFYLKPESFYIAGKDRKGIQTWNGLEHYHAIDIIIREDYFKNYLEKRYGSNCISLSDLEFNRLHYTMTETLLQIIQSIEFNTNLGKVTPIYIESQILNILAELTATHKEHSLMSATKPLSKIKLPLGHNKYLILNEADQIALHHAHHILTKEFYYPPTIDALAHRVNLNTQKLKLGFSYFFHTSIYQYICVLRMSIASNLLCETDLSINDIANQVGYKSCSKFSNMFRRHYNDTPSNYRKQLQSIL